jgi:hypothetical protein
MIYYNKKEQTVHSRLVQQEHYNFTYTLKYMIIKITMDKSAYYHKLIPLKDFIMNNSSSMRKYKFDITR